MISSTSKGTHSVGRTLTTGLVIVTAYPTAHYGLSLLSFNLEIARNVSVWFLPGGLLFGCLMVARGSQVGWVMAGDFLARAIWSADLWAVPANMGWLTITTSISPIIYAAITTALRSARIGAGFHSSSAVMALVIGMILAPAIVAPLMCLTYAMAGLFQWNDLPSLIPSFLIGDLVGIGTLAPLIMAAGSIASDMSSDILTLKGWRPQLLVLVRTVLFPTVAALMLFTAVHSERPEIYTAGKFFMFIPLTIVAVRDGWRGAATAIVILNFSIVLALAVHQVPITAIDIQLLLLSYSMFALIIGVLIHERRTAIDTLNQNVDLLTKASINLSDANLRNKELDLLNRVIISECPIGLAVYDHTGQCIIANHACAEIVGATVEGILSQNYNNIQSWTDSGLRESAAKSLLNDTIEHHAANIISSFGKKVTLNYYLIPIFLNRARHLLLMMEDITAKFEAEIAMRDAKERAEEASTAKSHFLATMSHELRTPLNAIIGFSDVMLATEEREGNRKLHNIILQSSNRLLELIDGILDFSRIDSGTLVIEPIDFSLREEMTKYYGSLRLKQMLN